MINTLQCNEKDDLYSMLKYLQENDIVDMSQVRNVIEMKKREELLKQHHGKITQGSDGKWRTYVKDETKKNGLRMIKKSSKAKLEDEIISYYKAHSNKKPTFDKMYKSWRSVQDHLVGDNTIYKNRLITNVSLKAQNLLHRK